MFLRRIQGKIKAHFALGNPSNNQQSRPFLEEEWEEQKVTPWGRTARSSQRCLVQSDTPNLGKAIQDGDFWRALIGTLLIPGMDEAASSGSQDHVSSP